MGKIKLFRGDQILIPGMEVVFFTEAPKINEGGKRKAKARKPRLQKPIQFSLLDLEQGLVGRG
jgi:hypothetical protein